MKNAVKKIVAKYNEWVANDEIYKTWESEDYDNAMVYENVEGDVIAIEYDENGKIIDAWEN